MTDFTPSRRLGDDAMRAGDFRGADDHYAAAWGRYAVQRKQAAAAGEARAFDAAHPSAQAFWLLLGGANAQFGAGDFEGCFDTCVTAFNPFKDLKLVVGNPFFHLRIGQASFELEPAGDHAADGMAVDNLARALICGGIEIFEGEDPKYLECVLRVLRPPEGFASWRDAAGQGCSVDLLNGATGFLAEVFAAKFGVPPPYPPA